MKIKLGFGIYFVDTNDNIRLIHFDLISSDLYQDAHAVIRGLRYLREQPFFKQIDKKDYNVWCDAGKHFRNNEIFGYFLRELSLENINGTHFVLYFFKIHNSLYDNKVF